MERPIKRADLARLSQEVANLRSARMAPTTERGYAHDWRNFSAWCRRARRKALPASSQTVALWVADLLGHGKKVATVHRYAAGVAFRHRRAGLRNPVDDAVRETLDGARRTLCEPLSQMRPLTVEQLRLVSQALSGESPLQARDRAIVVLGFATALRRSSLASLRHEDVTVSETAITIWVRREKQDRQGTGRFVSATLGEHASTCPLRNLKHWLSIRGVEPGPLFVRLDNGRRSERDKLSPNALGVIVKKAMTAAGIDGLYGTHSLRAGMITAAGVAGVNHLLIAEQSGHRSMDSLKRYFRPASLARNASSMIGL